VKVIVLGVFCGYNVKTFSLSSMNLFAIDAGQLFSKSVSTGCSKPVCTRGTQHYVTTSKEYLTDSHILFKYFELVFL